ncbi:HAD-IIA family hydrolase [soil metagenome]
MTTFVQQYDCLLLDLDGTVFRGHEPTDGAIEALADTPIRTLFVTNNASRSAAEVAAHLVELGFTADGDDIVTSAQSAAHLLAQQLPSGSHVLIIGTDSLAAEISTVGLVPVRSFDDQPAAVVQGHSTTTGWADLAEGVLAIHAGAVWVATNVDKTLPSERGLLPGNGSMVSAVRTATDTEPQVAGKPAPTLMKDALARGDFHKPLVVGDRLDTDIAGAIASELPSLMVLTGVNSARDAVYAVPAERPTFIAHDLRSLHTGPDDAAVTAHPAWQVDIDGSTVTISTTGEDPGEDGLSVVRATARAVWDADLNGSPATIAAGDDTARAALERWSLLVEPDRLA